MKFKRFAVVALVLFTFDAAYSQRDLDYDTVVVPQTRIDARDLGYTPIDVTLGKPT